MTQAVLAADIGGTKTLIALVESQQGAPRMVTIERYENDDFGGFAEIMHRFIRDHAAGRPIGAVCLGVAGPREGDRIWLTNRPWLIDAAALSGELNNAPVVLLNDFEATANGVELLAPADLTVLQQGEPIVAAPQLVIGAGTGLGIAYRVYVDGRYRIIAGEGGHMGFAPCDTAQADLWRSLYPALGRVSAEHVVSGAGLARIYMALGGKQLDPAEVSERAIERDEALAQRALDMFLSCYGAVAGDHALTVLARGGVFIAGGIAHKVLDRSRASKLLSAFNTKGGHSALVERMPIYVVLNEQVGLLGAALVGVRSLPPD